MQPVSQGGIAVQTVQTENVTGATAERRIKYFSCCFEFFQVTRGFIERTCLFIGRTMCFLTNESGQVCGSPGAQIQVTNKVF